MRTNSTSEPCAAQPTVDPPILRGLGLARLQGCRFDDSSELGQPSSTTRADPIAMTEGRYLLGVSAFWRAICPARHYLDGAIDAYDVAHRDEHLAFTPDQKAVCLVRAWPGSSSGPEMPVGPTRRPSCSRVGH